MHSVRSFVRKIPGALFLYRKIVAWKYKMMPAEKVFRTIYEGNRWGGKESVSGPGSDIDQTRVLVFRLSELLEEYSIHSMLDIPCGDFHWMQHVKLEGVDYLGGDIVDEIIERNLGEYASEKRHFWKLDIITDPLPKVDLVFCRDCLVHFSYKDIRKALRNIVNSGSEYLLTTTFDERKKNKDIVTGQWRPLNLQAPPFSLAAPLALIDEECNEANGLYSDKKLGLWRIADL